MEDLIKGVVFIMGACISLFCAFAFCSFMWSTTISRWACDDFEVFTGMKSQFSVYEGCYITLDTGEVVSLRVAKTVRSQKYNIHYEDKY